LETQSGQTGRARKQGPGNEEVLAKRPGNVAIAVFVLIACFLALAWYDGGREEQRMIVQPVELVESGA
jgi:hypothetical protein